MNNDLVQMQKSNVWEEASKLRNKDPKGSGSQKVFIVVGPPGSGKTGFIKTFKSDYESQTKGTNLMQYTFIKKMGIKREIIHVYQIASKSLADIIPTLISKDNFTQVFLILCLDLSNAGGMIDNANEWLQILRVESTRFVDEKLLNRQQKYMEYKLKIGQEYENNEDVNIINAMPIHTIIIGTKYDIFEKYDTQNRKWLSRCLRFIAHQNNASVYFNSIKNVQIGGQMRGYLQQKIGDNKNRLNSQIDHTRAIFVNNGQDNVRSMNLPNLATSNIIDILKKQLLQLFPVQEQKKKEIIDFSKYQESRIDNLILERQKELEKIAKMLHNAENRTKIV